MKILKYIALPLLAIATMVGCKDDPELRVTDQGPEMRVDAIDAEAAFGSNIHFTVTMNDVRPLSTLKAQLFFDEEMVGETTIRTKTNGAYEGTVLVPFAAEIPDGTAKLALVGQNIEFGTTTIEQEVEVYRPQPEKIYLVMGDEELEMQHEGNYLYTVTDEFPQKPKGYFRTDALDADGTIATFGWKGGAVNWDSTTDIPFSNAVAGEYTISFNLFSFEANPFLKLMFAGSELALRDGSDSQYIAAVALTQGETYTLEGLDISAWTIDPDWFTKNEDGSMTCNVIDGYYLVQFDTAAEYVSAMTCDAAGVPAMFDTATGKGALYLVGEGLGKPNLAGAPGWVPEKGLCLAPVAADKHQITAVAGMSLKADGINFKFFGQNNGWGPVELKGDVLSTTSDVILVGTGSADSGGNGVDSGNVQLQEGKTFEAGGVYTFTLTWNGGTGTLEVEQVGTIELPKEDLAINGTALQQVDASNYYGIFSFHQGDTLVPTGFGDMTSWWADPNYVELMTSGLRFKPVTGTYMVMVNTDLKAVQFKRVNADGTDATLADDGTGAIWLMAWGVGIPSLDYQFAWNPGKAYCMPEVEPGVYEIIGYAGPEAGSSIGQYFRYDYISLKYFHQNGWGGEMSDSNTTVNSDLLVNKGNLELADGVQLESGMETLYILRIDASAGKDNVVLTFDEYQPDLKAINGVALTQVDESTYECVLSLKHWDPINITGFAGYNFYHDPNYFCHIDGELCLAPVDGYYKLTLNTEMKCILAKRVNEDGTDATLNDDGSGAIWLMGWGVGMPSLDYQFGFNPGAAYCMPEIAPGVYEIAGYAGPEKDSVFGQFFRYDYISLKYFHQNGWGGEMNDSNTTLDSTLLANKGNYELAEGVELESGTEVLYILRIDASAGKDNVVVKFYKNE